MVFEIFDFEYFDEEVIDALEKLASSFKAGRCILVARKRILELISTSDLLSRNSRIIYKYIFDNLSNYMSYKNQFGSVKVVHDKSGKSEDHITYEQLSWGSYTNSPILLSENIKDAQIYKEILENILNSRIPGAKISAEPRGGGGTTTAREFEYILRNGLNFSACITDNDKKHPKDTIGATAKKVLKVFSDEPASQYLSAAITIDAREIENCIPHETVRRKLPNNDPRLKMIEYLDILLADCPDDILYVDIKSGLKIKTYKEYMRNNDYKKHWGNRIQEIAHRMGNSDCTCSKSDCHCFMIPPFGGDYVDLALGELAGLDQKEIPQSVIKVWESLYGETIRIFIGKERTVLEFMPAV